MPKKTKASKKQKQVVVNKKFLLDLANLIYDPKSKQFLRLCDGTLQNGPDPEDEERPMHCGLGELYYEMTGHQPKEDGVTESDVIDKAVELSTLPNLEQEREKLIERVTDSIKALKLPGALQDRLLDTVMDTDEEDLGFDDVVESRFREALDDIPHSNDDECGDSCSVTSFRKRSQRVAKQLREAAKILPA